VTATAAPTTTTPQVDTGPTIGDECFDWMKFSTDSATGQEMICSGYPDDAPKMTWYSTQATLVAGMTDAPRVGKTGSPCSVPPFTFGRSSDGYSVWCLSGQRALMPGRRWLNTPDETRVGFVQPLKCSQHGIGAFPADGIESIGCLTNNVSGARTNTV
jgi:hypothetical protein